MKVCIYTLGCKVNQYESGGIHRALKESGIEVCDSLEIADTYIINTCAVTAEAERKSRSGVSKCLSLNPDAKIFVIGCAVQKNAEQFTEKNNVVYVNGNANKKLVLQMLERIKVDEISKEFEDFKVTENSRTRAFVKVQDGCDNFCSYCIVPYLRGRSRSRNIQSVIEEIKNLSNCNEVVLAGINLSDYKTEINPTYDIDESNFVSKKADTTLSDSKVGNLGDLAFEVDKIGLRFRFGSLEVNIITAEFLNILKGLKHFCPQFHLSLQSGSTAVLKKMNRHYTSQEYIDACDKIKATFENANITTDIIVGFPDETDENFAETVALAKRVEFGDMHIFPYSKRSGTQAEKLKDLPKAVKSERVKKLAIVRDELKKKYIEKFIGKKVTVLTEDNENNFTVGHTENFIKVYIEGDIPHNKLVEVEIESELFDGAKGVIK